MVELSFLTGNTSGADLDVAGEMAKAKMKLKRKRGMKGGDAIVGEVAEKRSGRNWSLYRLRLDAL